MLDVSSNCFPSLSLYDADEKIETAEANYAVAKGELSSPSI